MISHSRNKMNNRGWYFYQTRWLIYWRTGKMGEVTAIPTIVAELHAQNGGICSLIRTRTEEYALSKGTEIPLCWYKGRKRKFTKLYSQESKGRSMLRCLCSKIKDVHYEASEAERWLRLYWHTLNKVAKKAEASVIKPGTDLKRTPFPMYGTQAHPWVQRTIFLNKHLKIVPKFIFNTENA